MTRDRISILHQNGDIELKEPARYTALNAQDTWDEYGSTVRKMHDVADEHEAPKELKDKLTKLRLDIVQAHQGQSTSMPTHDEFVATVDKYNAWVKTQSLHLDPTAPAPANPPVPPVPPAPSKTEKKEKDEKASESPAPADDKKASDTDERLRRLLDKLEGKDGVIERSDAHHLALYGDEDHDGLIKDVDVLKADYRARTQEPSFWVKMFGIKRNNRGH